MYLPLQKDLSNRLERLETGQSDIKDLIKHTTTLMTVSYMYIRRDLKTMAFNVNSDVDLLFKEVRM
ncbi:hypothetical protein E2K98_25225 [Bacillus salipaludis]|uniref:Uncharacterized protein n=1 Tax=Bacillus salipaludis TaxID=2547811 RepID=A0A4V3AT34_9BACI|nr:hypothetical protein [Bacillus salipaludis]MDQ6597790.1 hypothetical protein [Bacillus salipaludis]TDK57359.1 hypothetical protein E2K98_25225 [Bacillus salipaludis]